MPCVYHDQGMAKFYLVFVVRRIGTSRKWVFRCLPYCGLGVLLVADELTPLDSRHLRSESRATKFQVVTSTYTIIIVHSRARPFAALSMENIAPGGEGKSEDARLLEWRYCGQTGKCPRSVRTRNGPFISCILDNLPRADWSARHTNVTRSVQPQRPSNYF